MLIILNFRQPLTFIISQHIINYAKDVCRPGTRLSGLVLVSTGVWKLEKPSVAGHYDKSSTLKLNADENLAYAA